ncbi:thiamine-phosphate kinase [Saxibacter everestensis]|uniref:Thiamine-monophosphate kinase n=1 Tax=Saxibacter everestensis TaxID=2909229 RepID=A0ABY8QVI6_9MICO|nr:thiamine-phosphate kinase [Brevibacteriaceae bacterium ZFBP1038]
MVSCAELGEDGVLSRILPLLTSRGPVVLGPGDDAAVLTVAGDLVVTADALVENHDFVVRWSSGEDVGHKAAAQNLADVAAMGARPVGLLVSLAVPELTDISWLEGLARGLDAECAQLDTSVAGGDLSGAEQIMVSITAFGQLEGRQPVRRDGARPGDVVALAGTVGLAAAGLDLLVDDAEQHRADPALAGLIMAQLRPEPPYLSGVAAAEAGASAMLDVSDGLVKDASRIARASGVRLEIHDAFVDLAERLAPAAKVLGAPALKWLHGGGEDHGLLACFPPDVPLPEGFREIGTVLSASEAGPGVTFNGSPSRFNAGWQHFAGGQ